MKEKRDAAMNHQLMKWTLLFGMVMMMINSSHALTHATETKSQVQTIIHAVSIS